MLGRRTKRVHPSAGQTTWQYDQASNMTKQTMSSGEYVDYNYNYNQLSNVKYSHRYWNDVWYEYGGANNGNQTGRLVKQQDATGVQEFEYGNMGELIMNRHSYVVPNSSQAFSLTTRWEYDSWNRVKQIIYPDDEKVTYNYNLGGLLQHVEGDKNGNTTVYIDKIEYDDYEQRTAVYNGNNTSTLYDYDPVMRRMTTLTTVNPNGSLLKNEYAYDGVGNIISIDNVGMNPYHQEYNYDDTYQLMSARGNWSDINNNMADYRLNMSYSPSGKITNKTLLGDKIDQSGTYTLDHNTDYSYSNINPYAVRNTYDSYNGLSNDFDWDAKGNMILHHSEQWGDRQFCWTEDNRLQAVKDDKMGAFYNYDASGERNLKLSGGTVDVTQNGYTMNVPVLDEQTLYASALVTINDKGYTKHYFEEGKRICSKIGSGGLLDINTLVDQMEMEYEEQFEKQKDGVIKTYEVCMNITPHIKNENLYENIIKKYEQPVNPDEPVFYYHSDHLGSASYITDDQGDPTQHLVSLPFGEDWVDMKYNTSQFDTPYKFNGKEKDPETGLNYYGARYLNTDLSIWLSVDPMSDKYPHLTSYNYCANNPVMLVDPDGREFDPAQDKQYIKPIEEKAKAKTDILKNKMEKLDPSSEKYQRLKNQHDQYNSALTEIGELRADKDNLYMLNFGKEISANGAGEVRYGGTNDRGMNVINININSKNPHGKMGIIAHELKHAHQFFSGVLGFVLDNNGKQSSNNNYTLEKEANIRGSLFGGFPYTDSVQDYILDKQYRNSNLPISSDKEKFRDHYQSKGFKVIFNK